MKPAITRVLKSPVLHFILLGTLAAIAYVHLKPPDRETITITAQTIDALIQQRESITRNPTTPEERQRLIEGHIEDEILVREAYKRGFDKYDYRVRKRILSIMRSSLSEVIPEPSVAQLRAYYEENRDRFLTSASRSFEQIYFSFTSAKQPDNPERFLEMLKDRSNIEGVGEFSTTLASRYNKSSFQSVAITFGKPFAQTVFDLPLDRWSGPFESFRGLHYVRVTDEHPPELPLFEQMESFLRTDYFMQKARQSQIDKIDELSKNYEIVVEGLDSRK